MIDDISFFHPLYNELQRELGIHVYDILRKAKVDIQKLHENGLVLIGNGMTSDFVYILPKSLAKKILGPSYELSFAKNPYLFLEEDVLDNNKLKPVKVAKGISLITEKESKLKEFKKEDFEQYFSLYRIDPREKSHSHGEFAIESEITEDGQPMDVFEFLEKTKKI